MHGGRFAWLIGAIAVCGLHCAATAHAQGGAEEPWGAEVAKPDTDSASAPPAEKTRKKKSEPRGQLTFSGDRSATVARFQLRSDVAVRVFTLAEPYRVIVELAGATLPPPRPGNSGHGLVERYHSGQFEAGKSRLVMETIGPTKATEFPSVEKEGFKVVEIALTPIAVAEFGEGTGANPPPRTSAPAPGGLSSSGVPPDFAAGLPGMAPAAPPSRPVIVIDPGHGGIDPGAVGADNLYEKAIVMAVAQKLRDVLVKTDRYQVRMTREADVFVALDQRVAFSRQNAANLFISLHADSIEQGAAAQTISGATVYTLSERASDEQARKMAEKENASDLLAGLSAKETEDDDVKNILIDLMKRETATFSAEFATVVRTSLGKSVQLSRDPDRSAAFKVLKQTHAPSVLIELGYMSNAADAKRLSSPDWQLKVATSIANAIDAYFSSRTARAK